MTNKKAEKNIATIREILEHEIRGDVQNALKKMHPEYRMTWVRKTKEGVLFPTEKISVGDDLEDAYVIKGRKYRINHILADENTVMAEITESYPDPETGKIYRTPIAFVWEFEGGKIKNGRHYCEHQLSFEDLSEEDIDRLYKK